MLDKPFVAINSSIPIDCQVFAAAHELYHIWYEQNPNVLCRYFIKKWMRIPLNDDEWRNEKISGNSLPDWKDVVSMYFTDKNEYNDIREKSLMQWLDEMEKHPDVAVRGGVKLAREYVQYLQREIDNLKSENELKKEYMKKLKASRTDK